MKYLSTVFSLLFVGLLTGCNSPIAATTEKGGSGSAADPGTVAMRVSVVSPERKTLARSTTQPGRIEAFERTPLYAKIDGYVLPTRTVLDENKQSVEKTLVDIGDKVAEGEVLAQLSVPEMDQELRQKESLIVQAEAEREQAVQAVVVAQKAQESAVAGIQRADGEYERWNSEHERIKQLAASGSVTQKLVEETLNQLRSADAARTEARARLGERLAGVAKAQADQAAAEARVKVAQAECDRTKALLGYARIRAPFAGIVTQRNIDTGHFVRPPQGNSNPIYVLARTDTVRIFVDVPELEAPLVDAGDAAFIRVQSLGPAEIEGTVTRTAWVLDSTARTLRTEIDLPNADGQLRPGMYATVRIVLAEQPEALVIPATAVGQDGTQFFCACVDAGHIVRKKVTLGLRVGQEVEVTSGLDGGEQVVHSNPAALTQGQAVEVAKR